MEIKFRIWLEEKEHVIAGNGRLNLLTAIDELGSLSKAAKSLGMSYKKAWNLVDSMNKSTGHLLVDANTGGKNGGGSVVTPSGKKIMKQYLLIRGEFEKLAKQLEMNSFT